VTRYLVLWEHWQGSGDATPSVQKDLKDGTFQDWGAFATSGRGYVIVIAKDEKELLKILGKYRQFGVQAMSAEPVLSLDEALRIRDGG
jgi:hypothetical protein